MLSHVDQNLAPSFILLLLDAHARNCSDPSLDICEDSPRSHRRQYDIDVANAKRRSKGSNTEQLILIMAIDS